jgi:hypothetical protein
MHSGALIDPQNEFTKALKKVSAKRPKTEADENEMARLEFLGALYVDDDRKIVLPDVNIMATLIKGAAKFKKGKDAQAGVMVESHGTLEFPFKGTATPEALWESGQFSDRRNVKIQRNSIMRVRPRFNKWASRFALDIDDEICDPADVKHWLETAGARIGVGDYRPMFGRFEVVEWKEAKER